MTDKIQVNGECHCGKIEIIATVKLSEVRACHCTDCQQMSGAPLRAIAVATADKIKIKGFPKEYIKIGDSGNKRIQAFCPDCGTQLFATDLGKTLFNLRTGFLEQKNELKPKTHVFIGSGLNWMLELMKKQKQLKN